MSKIRGRDEERCIPNVTPCKMARVLIQKLSITRKRLRSKKDAVIERNLHEMGISDHCGCLVSGSGKPCQEWLTNFRIFISPATDSVYWLFARRSSSSREASTESVRYEDAFQPRMTMSSARVELSLERMMPVRYRCRVYYAVEIFVWLFSLEPMPQSALFCAMVQNFQLDQYRF